MSDYRLKDASGMVVASAFGKTANREIMHYAMMYRDDGPLVIERKEGRKWLVADWDELIGDKQ